jgi:hypothetical protein
MRINKIQNNETSFNAKLRVISKDFDKNFFASLSEKAQKIGLQHDIIELKYSDFQDIKENAAFGRKNILEKGMKRISNTFHGRFIPTEDDFGTDHFEMKLTADKYTDIWKQEEQAADKYLHILSKKYTL